MGVSPCLPRWLRQGSSICHCIFWISCPQMSQDAPVSAFHMAGEVLGLQVSGGGRGAVMMVVVVLVVLMVVEVMAGRQEYLRKMD